MKKKKGCALIVALVPFLHSPSLIYMVWKDCKQFIFSRIVEAIFFTEKQCVCIFLFPDRGHFMRFLLQCIEVRIKKVVYKFFCVIL